MVNGEFVMENPCRDCSKRHVGCHGNCDDYKQWQESHVQLLKDIRHNRRQRSIGYLGQYYRRPTKK